MAATYAPEKDYYTVLGVEPTASADLIDAAYRARVRVSHPDRFDRESQPEEWEIANEILRELNGAYAILREARSRSEYDHLRTGQSEQSPPRQPRTEPGFNSPCSVRFDELPPPLQRRLVERQRNEGQDQFQISMGGVFAKYFLIIVLLCWFVYLYVAADGAKWSTGTNLWQFAATVVVGWFISGQIIGIVKWYTSTLKSYFYVTPLYYIKTAYDIVTFWPIFALQDIAVTHKYTNGSYQGSDVLLKFEGHSETLALSNKDQVENLFARLKSYDARLLKAHTENDDSYFQQYDDFGDVPRTGVPAEKTVCPSLVWKVRAAAIAACGVGYFFFVTVNDNFAAQKWVEHTTPSPHHVASPPKRVPKPPIPEQPLPFNGEVRTFTTASRIAPFEIKTAGGHHYMVKLVDALTKSPVLTVFVEAGATVTVDVPLGTYEVRYTCGDRWYGYKYLFGDSGSYSRADDTFTFSQSFDHVSGYTITLYPVEHGNLHTERIAPTAF